TALLLVARARPDGTLEVVHEVERFVRLGEGVDASGEIREAALHRLVAALRAHREQAARWGAERVVVAGTSASRDAANRALLVQTVREQVGLDYEILSGEAEARWTYLGARSAFPTLQGPATMIDIGGGSTEIVEGSASGPEREWSLDVGSVRLTERCFGAAPPGAEAVAEAERLVHDALGTAGVSISSSAPFLGAAGTLTALALLHHGASHWAELDAPVVLGAADVEAWRARLLARSTDAVHALGPAVMAGRADVFPAGVLILDVVLRRYGIRACRVSPRGLRHGLALRALGVR
ncbi:MAG: exopolyphosphatase, partial [Rhodothermales bacterium]|nr:exopolyphosphatase [Rhodothermales bacterium]